VCHQVHALPVHQLLVWIDVQYGVVSSLNRPTGNVTGLAVITNTLEPKQLQLLHEVVPTAKLVGFLATQRTRALSPISEWCAASTTGQQILVVNASNDGELDTAFTVLTQQHVDALLVMADPFLNSRPDKIVALAARYALPAMYPWREFPKAEGLMSYGTELAAQGARLAFMAEKFSREPSPPTFPFNSR